MKSDPLLLLLLGFPSLILAGAVSVNREETSAAGGDGVTMNVEVKPTLFLVQLNDAEGVLWLDGDAAEILSGAGDQEILARQLGDGGTDGLPLAGTEFLLSMNAREVYRVFRRTGVELTVMETLDALKMAVDPDCVFGSVTGPIAFNYESEPEVMKIDGKLVAIAHNLGQTAKLLEEVRKGSTQYDVIRLCA